CSSDLSAKRCAVLFADGSVETTSAQRFAELSQRGLVQVAAPQELAEKQREVVAQSQLDNRLGFDRPVATASPAVSSGTFALNGGNNFGGGGGGNFSGSIGGTAG